MTGTYPSFISSKGQISSNRSILTMVQFFYYNYLQDISIKTLLHLRSHSVGVENLPFLTVLH